MSAAPGQPLAASDYLAAFLRRKWLFLALCLPLPLAVLAYSLSRENRYESTALVQVQRPPVDLGVLIARNATVPPDTDQMLELRLAARSVTTPPVVSLAATRRREPPGRLLGRISVGVVQNLALVKITASAPSSAEAAGVANAFATALVEARRRSNQNQVTTAINALSAQPRPDPAELSRLRALRAAQTGNASVAEPATRPGRPASPRPLRNTAVAFILSLLLATVVLVALEWSDRRIRRIADVDQATGLPLLATIPDVTHERWDSDIGVVVGFEMLRDALIAFNTGSELRSLLVTSPGRGDGKTTVAANLAKAMARADRNVLLVEADLREPQLASRLDLKGTPGLAEVLASGVPAGEAIQRRGELEVLVGGQPPPNASELLGSARMRELLGELGSGRDAVILDVPPLLAVSDAVPLLEAVSGVLVVARMDHTRTDDLASALELIRRAQARALGAVVTGLDKRRLERPRYVLSYPRAEPPGHAPAAAEVPSAAQAPAQQQS